jgi:hypothetical protein
MRLTDRLAPLQGNLRAKAPEPRILSFGEWLPDLPAFGNPGVTEAKNVLAGAQSYLPMKGLDPQTTAFDSRVRGAWAGPNSTGDVFAYVATTAFLYDVRNSVITDRSGATYATASTGRWEAVRYGSKVIFTNFVNPVQSVTIGADANFADHFTSTAKPKFRHIGVIGDFLVGGYTDSAANRVQWSAIGDSTDMDQSATTQSDSQDIQQISEVTGVVSGVEYGLVFAPEGIFRLTYVGSPIIFDIAPIEEARGTTIPGSIVSIGRKTYFWSPEGIYVTDGTQSAPVGHDRVDSWLLDQLDTANKHRVTSGIDYANETIYWSFPGENSIDGNPDQILLYNYVTNRFTYSDVAVDFVSSVQTQSYTLEQMDFALRSSTSVAVSGAADNGFGLIRLTTAAHGRATNEGVTVAGVAGTVEANGPWFVTVVDSTHLDLIGSTFANTYSSGGTVTPGNIDEYTSETDSLDAPKWKGGEYRLAGFGSDLKFSYFTGDNLTAVIDTAEGQMTPGKVNRIEDVRPLVDGTATISVGARNLLSDDVSYTSEASMSSEGLTSIRNKARYQRIRTTITGDWTHAQGVEVQARPGGRRHG